MKAIAKILYCIGAFGLILFFSSEAYSQKAESSNSREPASVVSKSGNKKGKKQSSYSVSFNRKLDQKVEEYEARMKANVRKYRKMEKLMKKPQYSDPLYFGHKKKPKKRSVNKRRLCNECGIVH